MDGEFQREAKKAGLFDVPVSSCEAELQELMRQIDIMVHNRKVEWEADLEGVKRRLQLRDQEVVSQRAALEAKHLEVGRLRHQLDSSEGDKTLLSSQYEQKLTQLRTQLTSLQLDYEKMERHHSKHTVGAEREKNQADVQLQDAQGQLKTAQAKILELQKVASEWAVQKRAFQQQVESLETQRKILADKCQLVQQQSSGYQDQLRKRRHLLEQTEVNFRSQLAHLEGHLARSQDTVEDKSALAQRLEERLRELDGGRKHEEGERAELEERCRAAEGRLRHVEDEKARLISELQSRDELITQGDRAMKQHRQEIAKMDESIALKDDMMRSLREESGQEARLQVHELQGQLDFEGRENARLRRIETQLQQDVERLQARLDESHLECAHLNTELASKIDELRHLEGTEMQQLQDQLAKAVAKHNEQEQRYQSHFDGMQSEVAALTSDLHYRDNTIATLSHNLASLERKEREEVQRAERYQHELQITNAQLDALRTENRSLRDISGAPDNTSPPSPRTSDAYQELQELRDEHAQHEKTSQMLEEENDTLRRKVASLTQKLLQSESANNATYQAAVKHSQLKIAEVTQEYERKLEKLSERERYHSEMLQSQLDTAVQQYEAEIARLRELCQSLKQQLKDRTHRLSRLQGENTAMAGFVSNMETIATSPARRASPHPSSHPSPPAPSPHPSSTPHTRRLSPAARKLFEDSGGSAAAMPEMLGFPELVIPSSEFKRPDSRQSITASFVAEGLRQTREVERLLDDHIASFEQDTEGAIRRQQLAGDRGRLAGDGGDLATEATDDAST